MVMIQKGDGSAEIEGKFGGTIFRHDQCGEHAQAPPRGGIPPPRGPPTDRQKAFRFLLNIVRRCFTEEIAAYWQDYANKHPRKNKKGETITLTWFQMFISYNINKVVAGEDPDLLPPGYELIGETSEWCRRFL
ncbi:unnamed protein product [marine sediment metagenome]|uniref:Uncharacterized protein n=1 Tax=marine sediment metagenome TaxID=412755 RepID=X1KYW8_9ZZZZ